MIGVNRQGEVWIFAEQEAGRLSDVPLELMSKGRELADVLSVPLGAVLIGDTVAGLAPTLIAHGADKVYLAEDAKLAHYQAAGYSRVLCKLI
jgi:electron transfer flavoprotein alpha subunit